MPLSCTRGEMHLISDGMYGLAYVDSDSTLSGRHGPLIASPYMTCVCMEWGGV